MRRLVLAIVWIFLIPLTTYGKRPFRIMFYNVENLFDCEHDANKNDKEFMPKSAKAWTPYRYHEKLNHIAQVIVASGIKYHVPDLVGLAEVENSHCLDDLTKRTLLRKADYRYVMTDSPDERGIDVALLYHRATFRPIRTNSIRIPNKAVKRSPTRDILHVVGLMPGRDTLHVFVCHMPSRAGGEERSEPFRLLAAHVLRNAIDSVAAQCEQFNVVVIGDFNDTPDNKSVAKALGARKPGKAPILPKQLYNLMDGKEEGTYRYRGQWNILDQFVVSGQLLLNKETGDWATDYSKAQILRHDFLLEEDKKYGGHHPLRTYQGPKYLGGYSDHLPICCDFY